MSEALKAAIEDSGMTRYAISKATGVAQPSLSRFVRGERSLSLDAVDALAEFLDLELAPRSRPRRNR